MVRYLRAANVKDGVLDLADVKEMNFTPQEQQMFCLRPGDVLVTEGSGSLRAVGAAAVWNGELEGPVCFQNTLLRLRPRPSTDPKYLGWWCRFAFADGLFASVATGANIFHISADRVRALPMTRLSIQRQRAIAAFLDGETQRIDALVTAKRRMIDLLDLREIAAAHAAITGAPLEGKRKPSGLPWLGDIPAAWGLAPVSSQFRVALGRMLNAERAAGGDMKPYLRNINVRWDRVDVADVAEMDFPESERAQYRLWPGDLLINEGGAGVGRSAIWRGEMDECFIQKSVLRLRSLGESRPEWMVECMRVAVAQKVPLVEGNLSTIPHLPAEAIRVWRFPFPPRNIQEQLLSWLEVRRRINGAVRNAAIRQIELLVEQRQALITAAVTGELEIPGAAA